MPIGARYGRLTVLSLTDRTDSSGRYYSCQCDCGVITEVRGSHLRRGNSRSCGCLKAEMAARNARATAKRDGASTHPLYYCWHAMVARCHNPRNPSYKNYGGRGITVCERWRDDPFMFYLDMGERPTGLTLERKNNDEGYHPSNCVWATRTEQQNNRRRPKPSKITDDELREIKRLHAAGTSQVQLSKDFKVTQSTISRYLSGKRRSP